VCHGETFFLLPAVFNVPLTYICLPSIDSNSSGKNQEEGNYDLKSKSGQAGGEHPAPEAGQCLGEHPAPEAGQSLGEHLTPEAGQSLGEHPARKQVSV
jgi:hypothetical protein